MSNKITICLRFDHLSMVDPSNLFYDILSDIIKRNNLDSGEDLIYAQSREISKESSKLHYHCYFTYASDKKQDSEMRAIRRILKNEGYQKHLFCCQKLKRKALMYLTYMFKDGDILSNNLDSETLVTIEDNIAEFDALKALPMREQLEKLYKEEVDELNKLRQEGEDEDALLQTDEYIGGFIIKEFKRRGHPMPYPFHMKQYITHIQMTLFNMCHAEIYERLYK